MPGDGYPGLYRYAWTAAERLVASTCRPRSARAMRMYAAAAALLRHPPAAGEDARSAAHDALDAVVADWRDLAEGTIDGDDVMRVRPGLWRRLMTEWPMMAYADALIARLEGERPLTGAVLEVGSGAGNTTERLAKLYGERLTWSDRNPSLVRSGRWAGTRRAFDFDADAPPDLGPFQAVVATNALHCAAHAGRTVRRLRDVLQPGGLLMIAEGSSPTRDDGRPWALDMLFSAFDGWWDRGGFRTRREWLGLLRSQGFVDVGSAALRSGDDDLGGVIWGTRP
jgi:long-chain acyl-CoA synthetase